jgi:hypothetical protein
MRIKVLNTFEFRFVRNRERGERERMLEHKGETLLLAFGLDANARRGGGCQKSMRVHSAVRDTIFKSRDLLLQSK